MQGQKKPARFPATDDDFRGRFLAIVHNHAIDCVRESNGSELPIHSHWAKEPEPVVGGRKLADRELDRVFARNDDGEYDAPAPAELRAQDTADQLDYLLRSTLDDLPLMQRQIVHETFFERRKRAEVAQRLGISVHTYDNHLQAAFRSLRNLLAQDVDLFIDVDRSLWYDFIEELCERHEASSLRRVSGKKGKRSTSKGDRSNVEGDRSNSERERGKNSRAGAA